MHGFDLLCGEQKELSSTCGPFAINFWRRCVPRTYVARQLCEMCFGIDLEAGRQGCERRGGPEKAEERRGRSAIGVACLLEDEDTVTRIGNFMCHINRQR